MVLLINKKHKIIYTTNFAVRTAKLILKMV